MLYTEVQWLRVLCCSSFLLPLDVVIFAGSRISGLIPDRSYEPIALSGGIPDCDVIGYLYPLAAHRLQLFAGCELVNGLWHVDSDLPRVPFRDLVLTGIGCSTPVGADLRGTVADLKKVVGLLSHQHGIDASESAAKLIKRQLELPNSAMSSAFIEYNAENLSRTLSSGSEVVVINCRLKPEEQSALQTEFPSLTLKFADKPEGHSHGPAAAVRKCEGRIITSTLHYRVTASPDYGYHAPGYVPFQCA